MHTPDEDVQRIFEIDVFCLSLPLIEVSRVNAATEERIRLMEGND